MNEIPSAISMPPTTRPTVVVGTTSPYPTVVTVCSPHQTAEPNDEKSCRSTIQITIAPTNARTTNVTARAKMTDRASATF